jgi:hypothetical protein
MRFGEYVTWFEGVRQNLSLETGCTQVGPLHVPTALTKPPWNLDWCIRFSDGKHIKIKERWWPRSARLGGLGYRKHFSFHYGELNPVSDMLGFPVRDSVNYPGIIRIDSDTYEPHMHYNEEDHINQNRVQGFNISDADLFNFINAVLLHRRTAEPFDKILKFTVVP